MKILLTAINAKYIHSNPAIYSLKASAGEAGKSVELAEFTINHRTEEILRDLYRRKPDVLLFSCYIWNIVYVRELAAEWAKLMPEVPVWLGGPEVSFGAEKLLEEMGAVTGILCGEGEESFRRLSEAYVRGCADEECFRQIPGLVWRKKEGGQIISNPSAEPLDMNSLPFLYEGTAAFENRIIYYESGRGCPFSCSYCLSSIDKSIRFRSPEKVCRELQFFLDARVPQVKFVDRTFNCRKSHAMAIWTYLLEHDNGVTNFHFEIAADLLDEDELNLIRRMRPGLIQLEIGVQSVNPKTLAAIRRSMDLERLARTVERVREGHNVHQHLDLIAGLPYEDYESFGRSFDAVFAMKPDQLQLGFLKVLKGSRMYKEAEKYGIIYRDEPPYEVLFTPWLPFSDVLRLKMIEEMVEIYYNSHQFRKSLTWLLTRWSSPFVFFEELAQFYEDRGEEQRKHSRAQRYGLLLEFAKERFPDEEDRIRTLLTIDYYLRERAKARPDFAPDQKVYQEKIRRILKKTGKQVHAEGMTDESGQEIYLIFDYERRDPLTGDARLIRWEDET